MGKCAAKCAAGAVQEVPLLCGNGCGRPAGAPFPTCCRKCNLGSHGSRTHETHGSRCNALYEKLVASVVDPSLVVGSDGSAADSLAADSEATASLVAASQHVLDADPDWRELFQARHLQQQLWDARKQGKESSRKERAERERQQAVAQDKQRGQNYQGQKNGTRLVRTKTCKRCGVGYLPKDNVGRVCSRHSGRCCMKMLGSETGAPLAQVTGTQVQQAVWSLRRKGKKIDDLGLLTECGLVSFTNHAPTLWYDIFAGRIQLQWSCCSALQLSATGCVSGPHT